MGLLCYNMNCPKVRNGFAISCDCAEAEECARFDGAKPKIDEPYSMEDKIRPAHYQGEYECIDLMREIYGDEAVRWFCILNAYKYRFRAGKKEGNEEKLTIVYVLETPDLIYFQCAKNLYNDCTMYNGLYRKSDETVMMNLKMFM